MIAREVLFWNKTAERKITAVTKPVSQVRRRVHKQIDIISSVLLRLRGEFHSIHLRIGANTEIEWALFAQEGVNAGDCRRFTTVPAPETSTDSPPPAADTAGWIKMCSVADLIWLKSPSNPLLTVADLDTICAAPRKSGAILGVDNTFATPLNQRPLALGVDVAVQSVTKFIGGIRTSSAAL